MSCKIISVSQQKGGAGKTTVAIQLCTAWSKQGLRTSIIDIDPQASLTNWMRVREHSGLQLPEIRLSMIAGWRLEAEIERLKRDADRIVIDCPPHAESDAKVAIRCASLAVIPVQPSPLDIWACKQTVESAVKEGTNLLMMLNRVPPRGKSVEDALNAIDKAGYPRLNSQFGNRQAFVNSLAIGQGVVEFEPKSTAAKEVEALTDELSKIIE